MARELRLTASMHSTGTALSTVRKAVSKFVTQAAAGFSTNSGVVPTSSEALSIGSVTTEGWLYIKNMSQIGTAILDNGSADSVELRPGDVALFRLDHTKTVNVDAGGVKPLLEWLVIED